MAHCHTRKRTDSDDCTDCTVARSWFEFNKLIITSLAYIE